jgi:hypothetical protein
MSPMPLWVREIEDESRGLPVLLVEGTDDVDILEHFFNQHSPGWRNQFFVAAAGGKEHVKSGVATHHPDWLGIMDIDERSQVQVQAMANVSEHLIVLPRFCIESFFCYPEEIWPLIPAHQQNRLDNGFADFSQLIGAHLDDWVAHGAMWRVLRELYHQTRLPEELERSPVTDSNHIREILTNWHESLSPDRVIESYESELANAQRLSTEEKLKQYVHGKKFFNQVVVQILDQQFSGEGADDWVEKFRDAGMSPPSDLRNILDWVLGQLTEG